MEKRKVIINIAAGLSIGFINGFFGGGGGMIAVPILISFLKREEKSAHATALLIILPISFVSGLVYLFSGIYDFDIGFQVAVGVFIGGIVGSFMLKKLSTKWINQIFSILMLVAGLKLLF